jgi:hypothetical protein
MAVFTPSIHVFLGRSVFLPFFSFKVSVLINKKQKYSIKSWEPIDERILKLGIRIQRVKHVLERTQTRLECLNEIHS